MYLHIGKDCIIETESIIGIFDIEKSSAGAITRDYLNSAGKAGQVTYLTSELPRSFIVTQNKEGQKVYLSQISLTTLTKRQKTGIELDTEDLT